MERVSNLTSKEQDPAKLTELGNRNESRSEQKTSNLDPPLRKPFGGVHFGPEVDL